MPDCALCHKTAIRHSKYCYRCRGIMKKAHSDFIAPREALKDAWNAEADGFLCKYTSIKVDERNPFSPWYISFDHPTPGKKGEVVVTVQIINFMKKDLTAEEFPAAEPRREGLFQHCTFLAIHPGSTDSSLA